jgi:chromosome segregation protein
MAARCAPATCSCFFADASIRFALASPRAPGADRARLINAKPISAPPSHPRRGRRHCTGLHTRRHEAELKLKAAEQNLSRVADIIQEIELQLANLKRQARQAARYRNLSGHIQRADALALLVRWQMASAAAAAAEQELVKARSQVEELTLRSAQASNAVLAADEKTAAAAHGRCRAQRGASASHGRAHRA